VELKKAHTRLYPVHFEIAERITSRYGQLIAAAGGCRLPRCITLSRRKKMIKTPKLVLVALLLLVPMIAFADSLNIKNGRYAGGPVIIIKLTEKQKERIDKKYKPYYRMKLTKSQQVEIALKAKMKEPPT
jgi:hypothetical protein